MAEKHKSQAEKAVSGSKSQKGTATKNSATKNGKTPAKSAEPAKKDS